MLISRKIEPYIVRSAQQYPALAIMGPRQSGKTTLAKHLFPSKDYVNLEDPDTREYAEQNPRGFLAQFKEGAIFDEIQRAPSLLSYLQGMIDADPHPGRFIVTGSHQLMLHEAITQSLAGRIALVPLLPLSLEEVQSIKPNFSVDDNLLHGFYPRIYHDQLNPAEAYRYYFQTYVERDVSLLIHLKNLRTFERFMRLCAGRVGQLLNYDSLANDVGVSATTIREWISLLEASYLIYLLPPYFVNVGKRLIKSPKLYFVDVGLAAYLLGIETPTQLARDPLRGHLFENLVVVDLLKQRLNQGKEPALYFYRDQSGMEVDVLFKQASLLRPIEIKASETFDVSYLKHLKGLQKLLPNRILQPSLIYNGSQEMTIQDIQVLNLKSLSQVLG